MKRLFILAAMMIASFSAFAQEDVADLKKQANDFLKVKDYTSAYPLFKQIISAQEAAGITDTAFYYKAAVSALKAQDVDGQILYFGKCIELNQKTKVAYEKLGGALLSQEKYQEAKTAMTTAVEKYPEEVKFKEYLCIAITSIANVTYKEYAEKVKEAESLKADVEKYNEVVNQAKESLKPIMDDLEEAYKLNPENENAKNLLKSVYTNLGLTAKANAIK